MALQTESIASAVGSSVKNVQFESAARNVPRKSLMIGTYDAAKTGIVDEVPRQILSPEDAGNLYGFGSMIHRLAVQAFAGGQGIPVFVSPQAEAGGAAVSTGDIEFAASTGVVAGTLNLYIAGISVPVAVTTGMTAAAIAQAVVDAITANTSLPVSAALNVAAVDLTAKSKGPWGDEISITFNLGVGQELPTGVSAVVTDMASGSGIPTIADALNGLGTGDDANEAFFTDVVHGYGLDSTTLDAISTYVGEGNAFVGLYAKTVARPFRAMTGDVTAGSAGLTALQAIADARKQDRGNMVIAVPDSENHPSEIAALAIGNMAQINQERAAQSYNGILLSGVWPGDKADRWTSDYDNRDIAVKGGISPTKVESGTVIMQNVVTFYRPDDVPVESNGYRSARNISILQNILDNVRVNFAQEKWQGISIVSDVTRVGNSVDRTKARDIDAVKDDLVALAKAFEDRAWLFESAFTIEKLKESGAVVIRAGGLGFDNTLSVILSGEGGIIDTVTEFDISIAALTG